MATKIIAGIAVEVNDEGFFLKPEQWTTDCAKEIATQEAVNLTNEHMPVLNYLREAHHNGENITIRRVGHSGVTTIKDFYRLFPGAPLKKASKIAGIPKPVSCI